MKRSIFISRELVPDSDFIRQLQPIGFEIIGTSLVTFQAVPFLNVPETDWIFFYSKQAVKFFFENVRQNNFTINAKLAVFGKGTAKALEAEMYVADFVGIGTPEANATYFATLAKGQKVLFPRAANSRLSIQKLLANNIQAVDIVVYDNQPRTDIELPTCDWLVFTSPLNAVAYFSKYELQKGQEIIAIGKTTATTLQQLGVSNVMIAEEPSEMALAQTIRQAILR